MLSLFFLFNNSDLFINITTNFYKFLKNYQYRKISNTSVQQDNNATIPRKIPVKTIKHSKSIIDIQEKSIVIILHTFHSAETIDIDFISSELASDQNNIFKFENRLFNMD